MLVNGVGRPHANKGDRIDSALARSEKLFGALLSRNIKSNYETVATTTLTSIAIDNNPVFIGLKSEIETFNDEVRRALQEKKEIIDYNWKYSMYTGLRNLLKEIVSTDNIHLKHAFLARAKQWFADKMTKKGIAVQEDYYSRPETNQSIRPITANTRPFTAMTRTITARTSRMGGLDQTSVNMSIEQGKSFFDSREEYVPSKYQAEILRDYQDGARSLHDSVEPPAERLTDFGRKTIPQSILRSNTKSCQRPSSQSKRASFQNKNDFRSTPLKNMAEILDVEINTAEEQNQQEEEGSQAGEGEGGEGDEGGDAEDAEEKALSKPGIVVPARKLYMDDNITRMQPGAQDIHIPMETRSMYTRFLPSGSMPELRMEHRWRNSMNKKVVKSREKQEFVAMMENWSHAKGRLQEESMRRNESNTYGSRFHLRTFVPRAKSANNLTMTMTIQKKPSRPNLSRMDTANKTADGADWNAGASFKDIDEISEQSPAKELDTPGVPVQEPGRMTVYKENGAKKVGKPEIHDFSNIRPKSVATGRMSNPPLRGDNLEASISKLKIEKIKKMHADLVFHARKVPVDVGQDGAYSYERPTSLSVYDQGKVMSVHKPFSTVIESSNPELSRRSQMEEVDNVKAKLAKFQIKVPTKHLKSAILVPEPGLLPQLPMPGTGLMINPFFKESRGGKKKKKGSKK